jgi:hypothetical protein
MKKKVFGSITGASWLPGKRVKRRKRRPLVRSRRESRAQRLKLLKVLQHCQIAGSS